MISLFGPFALGSRPFHRRRFALYMAGLAVIVVVGLVGERPAPSQIATAPTGDETAIVRFPQSLEDTLGDVRQIGLPWFLLRQGATARHERLDDNTLDLEVSYQGIVVGHFNERVVALGEGRSKLFVAFVPTDMRLVGLFAAPIKTRLDPVSLFRVVMAEHIRALVNGGGFDLNVLTESVGSRFAIFRKALADSGLCRNPQRDDFAPCSREGEDANVRRAYRREAARGGDQ